MKNAILRYLEENGNATIQELIDATREGKVKVKKVLNELLHQEEIGTLFQDGNEYYQIAR